jgi:4'-phosphopantetheinyl transferase
MTLTNKQSLSNDSSVDSLSNYDHIYVIDNFPKSTVSSLHNAKIKNIFSHYTGNDDTNFTYNVHGKPQIALVDGITPIYFSLSHSADVVVVIISLDELVGIDVEAIKPRAYAQKIAKRYFGMEYQAPPRSPLLEKGNGRADSSALKSPEELDMFYRHWTARESYIKALGNSLFQEIAKLTVGVGDSFTIGHHQITHTVSFFKPKPGFVGAICRPQHTNKDLMIKLG